MNRSIILKPIFNTVRTLSTTTTLRSHIGKSPIHFPPEVNMLVEIGSNHTPLESITTPLSEEIKKNESILVVRGPLGEKRVVLHPFVNLEVEKELTEAGNKVMKVRVEDTKKIEQKSMWGTTRSLINNAVIGVTEGFTLPLRLSGVGYRAALEDNNTKIGLKLGYSHPIALKIPEGITVTIPQPTRILLFGTDKQQLGQFAAAIRRWREPEPYKLKGVFVGDEVLKQKEMKKKQK